MDRPIFINYVLGMETRDAAPNRQGVQAELIAARSASNSCTSRSRMKSLDSRTHRRQSQPAPISRTWAAAPFLERLTQAEIFEQYLDRKYTGTKRFGLEGGESLIPAMEQIFKRGASAGLRRSRHRHAASRPLNRAGQFHATSLTRDLLGIPRQLRQPGGRAGLRRCEIPSGHVRRPGLRRQQHSLCP